MYEAFYGLKERPFNLTPDPKYLYLSDKHKEAFAHLLFGIKNRSGFVMVTGEIGTGKTTICLRTAPYNALAAAREIAVRGQAVVLQKLVRRFLAFKSLLILPTMKFLLPAQLSRAEHLSTALLFR